MMSLFQADEAGEESDRQRVLMQIVCDLCRRPSLNQIGFDMPTIYIENAKNAGRPKRCVNQIQNVVDEIKKTINMTVQNTLNTLEVDWNRSAHHFLVYFFVHFIVALCPNKS